MSNTNKDPQSFESVVAQYVGRSPEAVERTRPDISHRPGKDPSADPVSPTWERFAAGVRDGLGDFVSRLHGERGVQSPAAALEDKDHGLDR